jgi:hypothetical protein
MKVDEVLIKYFRRAEGGGPNLLLSGLFQIQCALNRMGDA